MRYNETLADRIREALVDVPKVKEKEMFSGVTFMVDDKMCISVGPDRIMCRIDPAIHDQLLEERACRPMVMKGREYKGYILVDEADVRRKAELDFWIGLCLDFNSRAKSSKKKAVDKAAAKKQVAPKKVVAAKKKTANRKK
ncbi:MAG: TfoX/Sxy family protein [Bacteroidetes bacterium]|nr:TfoX/Sxy family protein [Bacteroidota bacterium]